MKATLWQGNDKIKDWETISTVLIMGHCWMDVSLISELLMDSRSHLHREQITIESSRVGGLLWWKSDLAFQFFNDIQYMIFETLRF